MQPLTFNINSSSDLTQVYAVFSVNTAIAGAQYQIFITSDSGVSTNVAYTATTSDTTITIGQVLSNLLSTNANPVAISETDPSTGITYPNTSTFVAIIGQVNQGSVDTYVNTNTVLPTPSPSSTGIGIQVSGYLSIQSTFQPGGSGNPFEQANGLPAQLTVQTGVPIIFTALGNPGPLTNISWGGISAPPPTESESSPTASPLQVVWQFPGAQNIYLHANNNGTASSSSIITVNIVWGPIDRAYMRFVRNLVEGWESVPVYNSTYAGSDPIAASFVGWSAPIAAADQLDYFRRQQPTGVQYFPDYIGVAASYQYMSLEWYNTDGASPVPQFLETYGYPAWQRFTLDQNRPSGSATIASFDQTDFGWWMNTSGLGNVNSDTTGSGTYLGTTARGLYDGLNGFYSHVGHSTVTFGMFKLTGTTVGNHPTEYVTGAETSLTAYEQTIVNAIDNDKPVIILVNGLPTQPSNNPPNVSNAIYEISDSIGVPGGGHTLYFGISIVQANIQYNFTVYGVTFSYVATAADTAHTIVYNLQNLIVAGLNTGQIPRTTAGITFVVSIADSNGTLDQTNGTELYIFMNYQNSPAVSGQWANGSGTIGPTTQDDIPSSAMNSNVGPEHIRTIAARSLIATSPTWHLLNDSSSDPTTDLTGSGLGSLNHVTGNAYVVIGYIQPSNNSYLPTAAQNKFILVCRETGADRVTNIYMTLDQALTSTFGDDSLWNQLVATYIVSPTQTSYVAPRLSLQVNPAGSQEACINVPITLAPVISSGVPANNRFTHIFSGVGETLILNGNVVSGPVTFTSVGSYPVTYELTDAVSHTSGQYSVLVNPSQPATFTVSDSFGNPVTGTPLHFATGYAYTFDPLAAINPNFTYQWTITRTDAAPAPSDYQYISGSPSTAGPVKVQFNTAGQYSITLTTFATSGSSCPGSYTLNALVTVVSLSFTYTQPAFMGLPVTFTGSCSVAVSSWSWSFGDGSTGTGQIVDNTYSTIGPFNVTLTVMTIYGELSVTEVVTILPPAAIANFIYSPLTNLLVGETILFTNTSTPVANPSIGLTSTSSWNFGDGNTSSLQNPQHAYSASGVYDVTLTYSIFFTVQGVPHELTSTITKTLVIASGAPIVKSQTFIVSRNLIDSYNLSKYVTSTNTLTYSIVNQPTNGSLVATSLPIVQYQPNTNYVGPDVFTFQVTDNFGNFTTGNINLIVRPPELQVIVGEIITDLGLITINVGTAEINSLLLQAVTVRNIGTGNMLIGSITITNDAAGVFGLYNFSQVEVPSLTSMLIAPGDSQSFYVGILSPNIGTYTAKLQIVNN